jgi:hypothetical protein
VPRIDHGSIAAVTLDVQSHYLNPNFEFGGSDSIADA